MNSFSWSQIHDFMTCPRKWGFKYRDGITKPSFDSSAIRRGSMFHAGFEAFLMSGYDMVAGIDGIREKFIEYTQENYDAQELLEDLQIVKTAFRYYIPHMEWGERRHVVYFDYESKRVTLDPGDELPPMVEYPFAYEIDDDIQLRGYVDCVFYDEEIGGYVIADWKFRSRMQDAQAAAIDGQLHLYAAVINEIFIAAGLRVESVEMWQFNQRSPEPARFKNDGYPSVAAQHTTFSEWWRTLPEGHNFDALTWRGRLEGKLKQYDDFVRVTQGAVTAESGYQALENARAACHMILNANGLPAVLSAYTCSYCPYKPLCDLIRYGEDTEYLIAEKYELDTED